MTGCLFYFTFEHHGGSSSPLNSDKNSESNVKSGGTENDEWADVTEELFETTTSDNTDRNRYGSSVDTGSDNNGTGYSDENTNGANSGAGENSNASASADSGANAASNTANSSANGADVHSRSGNPLNIQTVFGLGAALALIGLAVLGKKTA